MTVSLWPMTCLVRHSCRAKYDTDLDQVKYIILPGSLTLLLLNAPTQPLALSVKHTYMEACIRHTELTYCPLWGSSHNVLADLRKST